MNNMNLRKDSTIQMTIIEMLDDFISHFFLGNLRANNNAIYKIYKFRAFFSLKFFNFGVN